MVIDYGYSQSAQLDELLKFNSNTGFESVLYIILDEKGVEKGWNYILPHTILLLLLSLIQLYSSCLTILCIISIS